eukprot:5542507-Alexandrium_andersonii.AAC.1
MFKVVLEEKQTATWANLRQQSEALLAIVNRLIDLLPETCVTYCHEISDQCSSARSCIDFFASLGVCLAKVVNLAHTAELSNAPIQESETSLASKLGAAMSDVCQSAVAELVRAWVSASLDESKPMQ